MNRGIRFSRLFIVSVILTPALTLPVLAGAHTWRVNEVFSNAAGNIQFIELRECCGGNFETGVNGQLLTSSTRSYTFSGFTIPPTTANRHLLIATPDCAALPGFPTPNYIIPAGSVPFFNTGGDFVKYAVYDTLTFASVPTDGVHSLNAGLVVACNTPTNFAGATGSINLGCSMLGDVNGSGGLDGGDIAGFVRVKTGTPIGGDNVACAEYCTGTLAGDIAAFVNDLL
ncbi:MAG: hypothetical protein HBSAPP02_01670 [Phycisphaerae bacterium]|nr:MAG: hypothetical protein HRU71_04075 [Planctomycetia bacterium]RIK66359.1 MAG: hypothetical protein DCC66_13260 [Planctomycetota bacterium]GJQ25135.1 MAG: hypothetical protein HBSAPP02_01670 [Phycisphaerae bacterium]